MLGIIFEILKWLGIVVLIILGLILAVLLAVLLVPVRYEAEGSCYGKLSVQAGVSWFFHLFSFRMTYDEKLETVVKIFGFPIGKKKEESVEEKNIPKSEKSVETVLESNEPAEKEKVLASEKPVEKEKVPDFHKRANTEKTSEPEKLVKPMNQETVREHKKFHFHPWKKIKVTWEKFCGKLKGAADKWQKFRDFLENEENRKTFRLLKKQFIHLLKHILPGTFCGKIRFGFDDPYKTGTVLTYISPFYGLYGDKIQVIPVFDEAVMEGELFFKGRIRIATLLWIGFKVWRDKNFRTLLKQWQAA